MRLTPFRLTVLLIALVSAAILGPAVREFLAIDSCLDSGGVYDYVRHSCRYDVTRLGVLRLGGWVRRPDAPSVVLAVEFTALLAGIFVVKDFWGRRSARPVV